MYKLNNNFVDFPFDHARFINLIIQDVHSEIGATPNIMLQLPHLGDQRTVSCL